ncbi:SidA/IucD/PvdA family monooxygenase [Hamadaea tsunoensis]|uniref:SidA/IucD/PvdA family monooxygenase n=1 Tax=Hamadaea tsunoensis TaxID=53368 RepID=UPI00040E3E27|nr:SidA/IucD/PvdA family monooxygenase [Hamadaea tsunoensis]
MTHRHVELLAVGAGPSNLALAIALEELAADTLAADALIIEQNDDIAWQPGMLLSWTQSQVSFLKDLVTLRNPASRFSFVSYLHSTGRLDDFINLGSFTPYRAEISGYLKWVAGSLSRVRVEFGRTARRIVPQLDADGTPTSWVVHLADGSTIESRYLVIGAGRDAHVPEVLADIPRRFLIHSTEYTSRIAALDPAGAHRILVLGGAQSAAEMLWATHEQFPNAELTMVMRSIGLLAYDGSKFTNELYYPGFIEEFYNSLPAAREQMLQEMHRSNYAGLAPGLLDSLYRTMYLQRLSGNQRMRMVTMADVVEAKAGDDEVVLTVKDRRTGQIEQHTADVLLLGTGFVRAMPRLVRQLSESLGMTDVAVTRHYRLDHGPVKPGSALCYLQGVNESTHGIADSLLSVLAARSGEITADLIAHERRHIAPATVTTIPQQKGVSTWKSAA